MGVGDGHPPPHLCRDPQCDRYGCVAYRDGYSDGYDDGFADGLAAAGAPEWR